MAQQFYLKKGRFLLIGMIDRFILIRILQNLNVRILILSVQDLHLS